MSRMMPYLSAFPVLALVLLSACSTPHGQPQNGSEPVAPNQVLEFGTLYAQNCAGCHGAEGRGGASIGLANPVYLAIVDENAVHNVVANGVRGTSMPAFAQSAGGLLTDEQINVITSGMCFTLGTQGNSRRNQVHLHTLQKRRGMPHVGRSLSEPIAHPATDLKVMVDPKAVPSPTIRFSRSSAIRDYARS